MKTPLIFAHANLDVFITVIFVGGVVIMAGVAYFVWLASKSDEAKKERDQNRGDF